MFPFRALKWNILMCTLCVLHTSLLWWGVCGFLARSHSVVLLDFHVVYELFTISSSKVSAFCVCYIRNNHSWHFIFTQCYPAIFCVIHVKLAHLFRNIGAERGANCKSRCLSAYCAHSERRFISSVDEQLIDILLCACVLPLLLNYPRNLLAALSWATCAC